MWLFLQYCQNDHYYYYHHNLPWKKADNQQDHLTLVFFKCCLQLVFVKLAELSRPGITKPDKLLVKLLPSWQVEQNLQMVSERVDCWDGGSDRTHPQPSINNRVLPVPHVEQVREDFLQCRGYDRLPSGEDWAFVCFQWWYGVKHVGQQAFVDSGGFWVVYDCVCRESWSIWNNDKFILFNSKSFIWI